MENRQEIVREKEFYKDKVVEIIEKMIDNGKGELLYNIVSILEILPPCECQRIKDYLFGLYLS